MVLFNIIRFLVCFSIISFTHGLLPTEGLFNGIINDLIVKNTVHFLLWTRRNPLLFQKLVINDVVELWKSDYVLTNPTKIYVHGFTQSGLHIDNLRLRDSFLQKEDCNFISVDWMFLAAPPDYNRSRASVEPIGIHLGNLIKFLLGQGAELKKFHLIGFSLGAHIVGFAGKYMMGLIPRITGLDPAGPKYENVSADQRLDRTDGQFVDIIHTNAGSIKEGHIGLLASIGDVDFWPNRGTTQPGCAILDAREGDLLNIIAIFIVEGSICSHLRAVSYYIESINSIVPFTASECNSYNEFRFRLCNNNPKSTMGTSVSNSARGNYFLDTNAHKPFAKG